MNKPVRKANRLPNYDYGSCGVYFITVCTKNKECIFWENVGASIARPENVRLSAAGQIVENAILQIPVRYKAVGLDSYVIMPNHIHILLRINADESGRPMAAPTISQVLAQMKGAVSKQMNYSPWQKLFYDHVVRGCGDYQEIWEYIENNPIKWGEDKFYCS